VITYVDVTRGLKPKQGRAWTRAWKARFTRCESSAGLSWKAALLSLRGVVAGVKARFTLSALEFQQHLAGDFLERLEDTVSLVGHGLKYRLVALHQFAL
jgi:hypothetical protein